MARRINKRSELDSVEETVNNENIVEKESIEVELKGVDYDSLPEEEKVNQIPEREFNFEIQKEYFLGTPDTDKQTEIDTLPEEEKVKITISEEDAEDLEENFDVDAEEEIEKMFPEKKVEVKVLPKQSVNLLSLSRSQLRIFQRTGRLPN